MNTKPGSSEEPATSTSRFSTDESERFRVISPEALCATIGSHETWVASNRHEGSQADFSGADLKEADFAGRDLRWAIFNEAHLYAANFDQANVSSASLQSALLYRASFIGTNLRMANMSRAHLYKNDFSGAKLQGVDLSEATGLVGDEFAGKDITGAKLPAEIKDLGSLNHITELSKTARGVFLGVIAGCVYSWLTIATTTDPALLINTASTPLPIVQTKVPIAGFFIAAPAVLLALYIYLHMYLQGLWSSLASLPARFPDGKDVDEKAYPWLLTSLVRAYVPLLKQNRPPMWWLRVGISFLAAWLLVPSTLVAFWLRYLPRHDWMGTTLLTILLMAAIWTGIATYRLAGETLSTATRQRRASTRISEAILTGVVALSTVTVSYFAINGSERIEFFGYGLYANLWNADLSTKPANWTGVAERTNEEFERQPDLLKKARTELGQVRGAFLMDANLRHASAIGAFLVKANLTRANFEKAVLNHANLHEANLFAASLKDAELQGVNLRQADLRSTSLHEADLHSADLADANLVGANLKSAQLFSANLEGAKLEDADLSGAVLVDANLQRANLRNADFQEAILGGIVHNHDTGVRSYQRANLNGADLSSARNLVQTQLDQACGAYDTKLPPGLTLKPCESEER